MTCGRMDIACNVKESFQGAAADIFLSVTAKVGEMAMAGLKAVTTFWVKIEAPTLEGQAEHADQTHRLGATAFLQEKTLWIVMFIAVLSVIIAGVRMAWEMRAAPARQLVQSLLILALVVAAATTVLQMMVEISDIFSLWIIDQAVPKNQSFEVWLGTNVLFAAAAGVVNPMPALVMIFLGLAVFAAAVAQVILMLIRSAMLVLLVGTFPIAAAATNTDLGRQMFRKYCTWLIGFIAYKPAAAIIYAAAMRLTEDGIVAGSNPLVSALVGVMMMLMAVFALPALMRFIAPVTAAVAGGAAGSGAGMADAGGLATGAISVGSSKAGRMGGGGGGSSRGGGGGLGGGASGAIGVGASAAAGAMNATKRATGALAGAVGHSAGEAGGGSPSGSSGGGGGGRGPGGGGSRRKSPSTRSPQPVGPTGAR